MSEPIEVKYGKGLYVFYPSELIGNMPRDLLITALGRGKTHKRAKRFG